MSGKVDLCRNMLYPDSPPRCDRVSAALCSIRAELARKCQIYVVVAWVQPIRPIWYLSTYGSPFLAVQTQGSICLLQFISGVTFAFTLETILL